MTLMHHVQWLSHHAINSTSAGGFTIDENVECSAVHDVNISAQCSFVNATSDCHIEEGLIDYTIFVYCGLKAHLIPLSITILCFWLLFLFIALAITADNFFCPCLVVMAKTMRMTDNIAGVTLLAFGNGAPDVFSAFSAVSNMKNGDVGLLFGALLGAGVFLTTVVVGAVCLVGPFDAMQRPFLRDIVFYIATVGITFIIVWDGQITLIESLVYFIAYIAYVIVVVVGRFIYQWHRRRNGELSTLIEPGGVTDANAIDHHCEEEDRAVVVADGLDDDDDDFNADHAAIIHHHHHHAPNLVLNGELEPLLHQSDSSALPHHGGIKYFLHAISPINITEWRNAGIMGKCYAVFKAPALVVITLTTPVVDLEAPRKNNWNKHLQIFQCVVTPVFIIFTADSSVALTRLGGVFYVWLLFLIAGCVLAIAVHFTSNTDQPPIYHSAFAFVGFIAAVMWIKMIANEIVNLLQTAGVVFHLSNAVLGLTFLAWGNSIGDFIADVAMAKRGFPRAGISACFGGPLFNTLLGIGIPFSMKIIASGGQPIPIGMSNIQVVLFIGLFISLLFTFIVVPLIMRFHMNKIYGACLVSFYCLFLIMAILVESNIIHW